MQGKEGHCLGSKIASYLLGNPANTPWKWHLTNKEWGRLLKLVDLLQGCCTRPESPFYSLTWLSPLLSTVFSFFFGPSYPSTLHHLPIFMSHTYFFLFMYSIILTIFYLFFYHFSLHSSDNYNDASSTHIQHVLSWEFRWYYVLIMQTHITKQKLIHVTL